MVFHEGANHICTGPAAHNMSILRQMAFNLLRRETSAKDGMAARHKQAD